MQPQRQASNVKCNDGTVFYMPNIGNKCPKNNGVARMMTASYTFYTNNTVKITFQNSFPEAEVGNNQFEIEDSDLFELPNFVSIGGVIYSGFTVPVGNYIINFEDGQFGSVILPINFVQ